LFLAALLIAYIPLTHMSHFIAKYFTYHSVRWDDAANPRGGKLEARLAEYLTYRPTRSAPHVGADGVRTWAQVAASKPASETKK
jgi:nitrate reductase gamma subunit